jgi:hypothetical protein
VVRYVLPTLVVLAVVVALVVSASGDQRRSELEYLEEIQTQAVEISKGGDILRDVVSRLQRIDRTEFVTVIEGLREDLAVGLAFVNEEPPTASLTPVRSLYRQALNAWDLGVMGYSASVLEAADNPQSVVVVDTMADSLGEIRVGDNVYLDLLSEMSRDDVPGPLSSMPAVVLMPAEGGVVSLSVSYVDSARSPNSGLALRPGLAVSQVVADPLWQVDPSDQVVVPTTEGIVFSVVITNVGNVASDSVPLVLTLTGGPSQIREQADVPPLQPNQQVTIIYDVLEVEPGGVYEVAAVLAITGEDANFDDNEIRVQFTVNDG